MKEVERGTGSWRTSHYANRNGNLYPTHGLGPVAQYMNLARGEDNFKRIVSMSSPGKGRNIYAKKNFDANHKWNQLDFKGGDINTSIIKTTLGRTIMVQWDETSPRPYTRHNLIQGTKGTLTGFPTRMALEGGVKGITKDHHQWAEGEKLEAIFDMRPYAIETRFNLRTPIYSETAAYGHMGRECKEIEKEFKDAAGKIQKVTVKLFPWEELNYAEKVKTAFSL